VPLYPQGRGKLGFGKSSGIPGAAHAEAAAPRKMGRVIPVHLVVGLAVDGAAGGLPEGEVELRIQAELVQWGRLVGRFVVE
jgi:hypothetical protein